MTAGAGGAGAVPAAEQVLVPCLRAGELVTEELSAPCALSKTA